MSMMQPEPDDTGRAIRDGFESIPVPCAPHVDTVRRRGLVLRRRRRMVLAGGSVSLAAALAATVFATSLPGGGHTGVVGRGTDRVAANRDTGDVAIELMANAVKTGADGSVTIEATQDQLLDRGKVDALAARLREHGIAAALMTAHCSPPRGLANPGEVHGGAGNLHVDQFVKSDRHGDHVTLQLFPDRVPKGVTLLVALGRPGTRPSGPGAGAGGEITVMGMRLAPGAPPPTCVPDPLPR